MSVSFGGGYLRTKLELIRLRRSVRTAQRVYKILEDKRDVLVRHLNDMIDEAQQLREQVQGPLEDLYRSLIEAYLTLGANVVETISSTIPETMNVNVSSFSMMGISIPTLDVTGRQAKLEYGLAETNVNIDEVARKAQLVIKQLSKAAATESAIFRIAEELKKTQRLLNALEYVVIPRYMEAIRNISTVLDEAERDYFIKLKHIKRVLERRKIGTVQG
ncbi:MAG: V-type ATP synthase subunit D [Aigarchaeota archaeon]|nr:V-type ATP synthase subunit D [Aigarchaeota archaeon]MDW8092857.1 V-type ATP synthase subunit D [Nitrososphaerota archaeon]